MKKRAATKKSAAKPRAAKKAGTRTKPKPAARTGSPTVKVSGYTPPALKSDGWPPFRYPLQ
jgi:hypothetical protein